MSKLTEFYRKFRCFEKAPLPFVDLLNLNAKQGLFQRGHILVNHMELIGGFYLIRRGSLRVRFLPNLARLKKKSLTKAPQNLTHQSFRQ